MAITYSRRDKMRIQSITLREFELPLLRPFETSGGVQKVRRILLVQIKDSEGIEGVAECVAPEYPDYTAETVDTAWHALTRWIGPLLLGKEIAYTDVYDYLEARIRGHRMAKAAIEMAGWVLEAERRGISLAQLLGGTRSEIEVGISLGIQQDVARLIEHIQEAIERGYRRIKLKIKPGKDVAPVAQVREVFGEQLPLMVDANNAYTLEDSSQLQLLDTFQLMMIEQPLEWEDLVRHAILQQQLKTPICLDESITSPMRAEDMVRLGSGKIINLKPARVGGFMPSLRIHAFCQQKGIPLWCGGMLESGVGRAYNVALASLPGFSLPGDISESQRYWMEDIVAPAWEMHRPGYMAVPLEQVGLGVEILWDRVYSAMTRECTLTL